MKQKLIDLLHLLPCLIFLITLSVILCFPFFPPPFGLMVIVCMINEWGWYGILPPMIFGLFLLLCMSLEFLITGKIHL